MMKLLSPSEVARTRASHRKPVVKQAGNKANTELIDNLDVMVLADDEPFLAFDVRQDDNETWTTLGKRGFSGTLGHLLGWQFSGGYVEVLVKLHQLNYGQSIDGGSKKPAAKKPSATKQPAAKKPAAKKK